METDSDWRNIFEQWPAELPRQGILTVPQESFGFSDFLISRGILMVERDRPDAIGARKIMVPFRLIQALKLTDPGPLSRYESLGFTAK